MATRGGGLVLSRGPGPGPACHSTVQDVAVARAGYITLTDRGRGRAVQLAGAIGLRAERPRRISRPTKRGGVQGVTR
jgi:hypothetical protein